MVNVRKKILVKEHMKEAVISEAKVRLKVLRIRKEFKAARSCLIFTAKGTDHAQAGQATFQVLIISQNDQCRLTDTRPDAKQEGRDCMVG